MEKHLVYHDCQQNTEQWHSLRLGKFTASSIGDLFSNNSSLTYKKAIYRVVYERITGTAPIESFSNGWIEFGHYTEQEAALMYELETFTKTEVVGFYELNEWVGASPDRKIKGLNAGVEIKCVKYNTQMDYLLGNKLPSEHRYQIHSQEYVTGWDFIDFVSYCPGLPLFIYRVNRDESMISKIEEKLNDSITSAKQILEKLTEKTEA